MLSSPRKPVTPMRIFHSAETGRRVARRLPFTTCSAGSFTGPDFCPICAPSMATMGQKSSLPHLTRSVSVVLMPDNPDFADYLAAGKVILADNLGQVRGRGHRRGDAAPRPTGRFANPLLLRRRALVLATLFRRSCHILSPWHLLDH